MMYKQFKIYDGSVSTGSIIRTTDGACIPFYQAYLEWVAEGNTPEPADE